METLDIQNLHAIRTIEGRNIDIITNLNFSAMHGEFVAVTGPNGAGKSTLFSLITQTNDNTLRLTDGTIKIGERTINSFLQRERAKKISFLPQNEYTVWNMTVTDYLLTGRFPYTNIIGDYSKEDHNKVNQMIEEFSLTSLASKTINSLSGGEYQKIRICRTLLQESSVMILDEPVENLDFNFQYKILEFIKMITVKRNLITLVSIHELNLVPLFADKMLMLEVAKDGIQKNYFSRPEDILNPQILNSVYHAEFGVFEHPKYKIPQVYIIR